MAAFAAAALLYAPVATGLARQWYDDPTSSHGIVLIAAVAWLVRRQWPALGALPTAPSNLGFAALTCTLLVYIAGTLAGELFLLRVSAVASLGAVVLALYGTGHLRLLAAPLALALLAIPLPASVVTSLTLPLQLTASQIAEGLLHATHIDVVRDGNLLALSSVTLEVNDACSGLRSIVSLGSLIAVFAATGGIRGGHAAALLVLTMPVAIIGNSLRVWFAGVLAETVGPWTARGLVHDVNGYLAFAGMATVLILVYRFGILRRPLGTVPEAPCDSRALAW
jgi:exosortase